MAKILLSTFSNVTFTKEKHHDSFVQGFINALERAGNEVISIYGNDYSENSVKPELKSKFIKTKLMKRISDFNPELIITFNNYFPCEEIITKTECPIVLYTADGCDFFPYKDLIEKYNDRYIYLNLNESIYNNLREYFSFIKKSQFCDFGYATDFRNINIEQDINISFLGSVPNYIMHLSEYFIKKKSTEEKNNFMDALKKFKEHPFGKLDYEADSFYFNSKFSLETLAIFMLTTKDRFGVLSALTDLGLQIYGYSPSFCEMGIYNYDILDAYNFETCVTQEQSEKLFNRSKISLNLPNARATSGFSWRVPDILATQSVLLCNKKKDLDTLMDGYIKMPQYESPAEARELAIKLLNDNQWRKDITLACNQMIEDKCRFEQKIKNIQEYSGIKLFTGEQGSSQMLTSRVFHNNFTINWHELVKLLPYFIAKKMLFPPKRTKQ